MPTLPTTVLQHQTLGAEPSGGRRATGADFGGEVAGALRETGRDITGLAKDIGDKLDEDDARTVLSENAKLRQEASKMLDEAELSGADTDKVRQHVENKLADLRASMRSRKTIMYADQHGANTTALLDGEEKRITVERARVKAVTGASELIRANSDLIARNPAYVDIAQKEIDAYLATQTGIPASDRTKLAENLKSKMRLDAALRFAEIDPAEARQMAKDGKFDLEIDDINKVLKAADNEERARKIEERLQKQEERQARADLSNTARQEHFLAIEDAKPGQHQAVYRAIIKDKRLNEVDQEHLVVYQRRLLEDRGGTGAKSDPSTVQELATRIFAPDGDPKKITTEDEIYAELRAGKINVKDFRQLKQDLTWAKDSNNQTVLQRRNEARQMTFQALLADPRYTMQPFLVNGIMNRWDALVRDRLNQEREAGRPPSRIFDLGEKDSVMSLSVMLQIEREARADMTAQTKSAATAAGQATRTFADGVVRALKPGGNPRKAEDWVEMTTEQQQQQAAAAEATRQAATPRPTFNGVTVPPAVARGQSLEARIRSAYPRRRGETPETYDQRITTLTERARSAGAE